mmetsp:Transcript_21791/g.49563  ORF Transcript_21791/g.49563 Transcript_21791/m.49563 type:complete len:93 (+) Transcript_21791:2296-2574(+)
MRRSRQMARRRCRVGEGTVGGGASNSARWSRWISGTEGERGSHDAADGSGIGGICIRSLGVVSKLKSASIEYKNIMHTMLTRAAHLILYRLL